MNTLQNQDNTIILHLCLAKIYNYQAELFFKIKQLVCYQFRNKEELQKAVDFYTNDYTHSETYNKYFHISLWDTSLITDMSKLFYQKKDFNENINVWDVSQVTNMESMFQECNNFN